jgi:hypothetical protein
VRAAAYAALFAAGSTRRTADGGELALLQGMVRAQAGEVFGATGL